MIARLPVVIQTFLDYVAEHLPEVLQKGVELINQFANGILQAIPQLVAALPQIIVSITSFLANNWYKIIQAGFDIIVNLITGVMNAIPDLVASVPELIDALVQGFSNMIETYMEIGASIVQGIIDGISAAWNGLVEWFNDLWDGLFGGRSVDVNVNAKGGGADGSARAGLDYVPYNGYIAELHKGEAVLTRQEASNYRRGNPTPDSGVTVHQTIYAATQTPVELAAATKAYFQRARWALA